MTNEEFWEKFGFKEVQRRTTDENYHTYEYPDGLLCGVFPEPTLDNLFRYCVPHLGSWDCLITWVIRLKVARIEGNDLDPAIALKKAIEEIVK
jgi:hypothetical protein